MPPSQTSLLSTLEPIAALSQGRISELAKMCMVETVSKGLDPFRMNVVRNEQLFYLLKGDLSLALADGQSVFLRGGSEAARRPVIPEKLPLKEATALTDIQILRIDADLLDIMLTWDQLAGYEKGADKSGIQERSAGDWMDSTGVFTAETLQSGIFSNFPPANVEEMFRRMERMPVTAGQVIIRQGEDGFYYYLIELGTAEVARVPEHGAKPKVVALLESGSAFGEEALVSDSVRNATVTMKSDGVLLRLGKKDFIELLKKPVLHEVPLDEAKQIVEKGAVLLDVRTPQEYSFRHLPNALNIPLYDIRDALKPMNKNTMYITYCQTGRRAAAAAFIMKQRGYNVVTLNYNPMFGL